MSHLNSHGTVTLPADYARTHVRLGYAATAHAHQGDTVDIGIAIVTAATSHPSLYVGATRGRHENRLLVVTDEPDQAREVLEQVLANQRGDTPAIAQRRNLAAQHRDAHNAQGGARSAEDALAASRRALAAAKQRAEPFLRPLHDAEHDLRAAEAALRARRAARETAPLWRRRGLAQRVQHASHAVTEAQAQRDLADRDAAPYVADIDLAHARVRQSERDANTARIRDRLDQLAVRPPTRGRERGIEIDPPGR